MSGGHRGKGAGWYIRLQAAKEIQGGMQFNSPASPVRRGGGRGRDGTFGLLPQGDTKDKRVLFYCFRHIHGYSAA